MHMQDTNPIRRIYPEDAVFKSLFFPAQGILVRQVFIETLVRSFMN